jgi:hypothetical protein
LRHLLDDDLLQLLQLARANGIDGALVKLQMEEQRSVQCEFAAGYPF